MANVLVEESTMSAIGNAIREKTGKTDLILPKDMPTEIEGIVGGSGSNNGHEVLDGFLDGTMTELNSNIEVLTRGRIMGHPTLERINMPYLKSANEAEFAWCMNLKEINLSSLESLPDYGFQECFQLESVNCPNVKATGNETFNGCESLRHVSLPNANYIEQNTFIGCSSLTDVLLPCVTELGSDAFGYCSSLEIIDLPKLTKMSSAFPACTNLKALIIRTKDAVCELTGILGYIDPMKPDQGHVIMGTGHIYVPSELIEEYKVADNWNNYVERFRALEDYTVDGTVTGEFDATKL